MLNDKYKLITLFGKSSAGKDTILKKIVSEFPQVHKVINCTTRPKRENEIDGVDYYFLTNEEFAEKVLNGEMLEATSFNDWFYGTMISALDINKINVGAFNIEGINCLTSDTRLIVQPVEIYAPDKERLLRSLNRETNPNCHEICRRFLADEKDFEEVDFYHDFYQTTDNKPFDKDKWERILGMFD